MRKWLLVVVALVSATVAVSTQGKRVLVVKPFTVAAGVDVPYDTKVLQPQLVANLKVHIKDYDVVAEAPAAPQGSVYTLEGEITGWRPGNAAKRMLVGMGSGREATDIHIRVANSAGEKVLDRADTVRTNYFSQAAGSIGTLVNPIALKIAQRVKDAKLK